MLEGGILSLEVAGRSLDFSIDDVTVSRLEKEDLRVINEGSLTVAIDTKLSEDLVREGAVRDMVRTIQNMRKEKGLNVTDRITLSLFGSDLAKAAVEQFEHHLTSETLAVSWKWSREPDSTRVKCGDETCFIALSKAPS